MLTVIYTQIARQLLWMTPRWVLAPVDGRCMELIESMAKMLHFWKGRQVASSKQKLARDGISEISLMLWATWKRGPFLANQGEQHLRCSLISCLRKNRITIRKVTNSFSLQWTLARFRSERVTNFCSTLWVRTRLKTKIFWEIKAKQSCFSKCSGSLKAETTKVESSIC